MPVSTGMVTDGNSRAVVSVTGDNSDGPTSTVVGADGTTSTRAKDSDGGATSKQESSSSRLISVEDSFDIVGGGPRIGASPTRVVDSSERSSEPIDGTVAAESGEQEADSQGRSRTPVVWGQVIPLRPAMTIRRTTPKLVDKAAQTTSQVLGVQTSILSNILPGHASVTDAVTRLQRERDLALRRIKKQVSLLKKVTKERDDARNEVKESQQSVINMFNEQKRHESQIDRMKDEVSRSNKAVGKMRDEVVRLRSKVNDLRDEKSDLKKQHESHTADEESAARERDTIIADLRSLLDRRNQQLNDMEQSVGTIEEDRTRIQLHSNEVTVTIVSLRRELDEARAGALAAQISRMMDEQLAQNQTIDTLQR